MRAWQSVGCLLLLGLPCCEDPPRRANVGAAPESFALGRPPPVRAALARPDAGALPSRPYRVESPPPGAAEPAHPGIDLTASEGGRLGTLVVDHLVDVGAAGPAVATPRGVVTFDRDNHLWLAALSRTLGVGPGPRPTPVAPLPERAGPFPLARGAAVRGGHAYWVSRGRLLRQSLALAGSGRLPEVLREDARAGTRVAAPSDGSPGEVPEMIAYVASPSDPEGPSQAKLWVAGSDEAIVLSPDLSSASSVTLPVSPVGLLAVFLEARTGMSMLHAREVSWSSDGGVTLGADRVVWVGGPARSTTELSVLVPTAAGSAGRPGPDRAGRSASLSAWMPLEKDITHFGLLRLDVPLPAEPGAAEAAWWLYDNGIEPAPVAATHACGQRLVVAARPTSARPGALQELVIGDLGRVDDAQVATVARSSAFFDASLAPLGGGALLTYVADHRTWARTVRCSSP